MDAQFEWQEEFVIGVDSIDKEHQRLFKIINKLFRMKEEEKTISGHARKGLSFLKGMR